MKQPFGLIVVLIVCAACAMFLWGTVSAGRASLACDQPPPKTTKVGDNSSGTKEDVRCDRVTHEPRVNPLLEALVTPLAATLATFFGAALGLAKKASLSAASGRQLTLLNWGAAIAESNKVLALLQTIAAYVYLLGLVIAFVYLYIDADKPGGGIDSSYTHIIIKTQGTAMVGVIVGVVALALGVQPDPPNTRTQ